MEERFSEHTGFLARMGDGEDVDAWKRVDRTYRPILLAFARRLGLAPEDAADVAQETMLCFFRDYQKGRWDRSRGRLSSWLLTIARCRVSDLHRKQARAGYAMGSSVMRLVPADSRMDRMWEEEHDRDTLRRAWRRILSHSNIEQRTLDAFERYAIHGRSVRVVAEELGMKSQDVYLAKSRVASRLRDEVQSIERERELIERHVSEGAKS